MQPRIPKNHNAHQTGFNRRAFLQRASLASAGYLFLPNAPADFDVHTFGATGDGATLDTAAIQRAIDAAAASGKRARVLLRGKRKYRTGPLQLRSNIEFHLADDAELLASTDPTDYPAELTGILNATGTQGLILSGTGNLDGQAHAFYTTYSTTDERWEPKPFRPRMFMLIDSRDLTVRDLSFGNSPNWGLHLLGCEHVLIDHITIRNLMDIPNCDGIDPDHCRNVEIRNCDITGADDSIVIKTSKQDKDYGPSTNITVANCTVTSRDSGLKIGTETYSDISNIRFHNCIVRSAGRGPTITHRQSGNISNIEFRDITLSTEHHAARWWGTGEAINLSVRPRRPNEHVGTLSDVRLINIKGRAENSVRIDGTPGNLISNVTLDNVDITIDKWTHYPGGNFDNRPTLSTDPGLEPHTTPAFSIRNAKDITLHNCTARWGTTPQPYWSRAVEAENVTNLKVENLRGSDAPKPASNP